MLGVFSYFARYLKIVTKNHAGNRFDIEKFDTANTRTRGLLVRGGFGVLPAVTDTNDVHVPHL
jgi:hypothetical protein